MSFIINRKHILGYLTLLNSGIVTEILFLLLKEWMFLYCHIKTQ